jgi:hypothetical protein
VPFSELVTKAQRGWHTPASGRASSRRPLSTGWRLLLGLVLLLVWASQPATSPTAETFPEETETYQSGGIVEFAGPFHQPVPVAKRLAVRPPGPAVQAVGSGELTLTIDETVDPAYEQYILDLFQTVYPVIVDLYGQPSNTIQVTVHFDDTYPNWFFYNSSLDQIVISAYPDIKLPYDPNNPNDRQWDGIVTHELIHAFHDTVFLFASWPEEGLTEAATELVADHLYDQGIRDIRQRAAQYNLLMSDTWNVMGPDVLGGTAYSFYKAIPDLFYRAAPALFWKLTTSQSQTVAGDWPSYDFLKRLNQALYDYAENTSTYVSESTFLSIVETVATQTVDGLPARSWVAAQSVATIDGPAGTFLAVYPSRWVLTDTDIWVKTPTNPDRVYAFAFRRTPGQSLWDTQETLLTNGDQVDFVIEDATGTQVYTGSIELDRAWAYAGIDTSGWDPGAYKIRAEATIDGEHLTAENAFIVGPSVVSEEDGVGLVLVDGSGQLVSGPVTAEGGTLTLNANGAAVVVPDNLSQLPEAPAINQQMTNLPLPYTRVRTLAVVCKASVADVSGDGQVDVADLQLVAESWRTTDTAGLNGKDLNGDGRVDIRDIMMVASEWGAGCN